MKKRYLTGCIALVAAAGLAVTGCSGSDTGNGADTDSKGTITLGFVTGWTDGESLTYLTKDQLEKLGYEVEVTELVDAGVTFTGLAAGDFDIFPSAWPEVTHKSYMEEVGQDLEDLTTYYQGAVLTLAVPQYMDDVTSIEDLVGQADRFDGRIVGIEPGAGLTKQTEEVAMPAYGLDADYKLVTSSTGTMLATLEEAIDKQEDIVVTLWRPFWANDAFPVKDLEDPRGAMGTPEGLHELARPGFSADFPEAAELIKKITLSDEAYGALESLITSDEFEKDPDGAVDQWINDYPDAFDGLLTE